MTATGDRLQPRRR